MSSYLILFIIVIIFLIGIKNKVNCFDSFLVGAKDGIKTSINMFSSLLVFMIALQLFLSSGIIVFIEKQVNFEYSLILIQMFVRPLSSSSSLSIMTNIYNLYGVDSFIAIVSTMIHYVSDASIYLIPFYCGIYNIKKYDRILFYGIVVNIISYILAILICILFKIIFL